MELLEGIYSRRSVRNYTDEPVTREELMEIVRAGSWAPSGLNNQPWRFVTVQNREKLDALAELTTYRHILTTCTAAVAVFLHRPSMYHEAKDHLGTGACLQNMLLAAHAQGIGAVWLGEILKNAGPVRQLFELSDDFELMAVIALGRPEHHRQQSSRKGLDELIVGEF